MNIEICNYTKKLSKNLVLENINLSFAGWKIYGFVGKNGSGKTMLMRAICGLILPTSGFVKINNKIIGKDISFPDSVGALIENPGFISEYSGFQNLKILAQIQKKIDDKKICFDGRRLPAVVNIGSRPTVGGTHVTVEPWILDFDGDLYGCTLRLEFYTFLRPERKFDSLDELRAAILHNAEQTREFFRDR